MNSNIDYYNNNSRKYIENTVNLDVSNLLDEFLSYVKPNGRVLDLGCGSGRDSVEMSKRGFDCYAVDGSEKMVEYAKKALGDRVELATFEDYATSLSFDGILAMSSLLHVKEVDMCRIVRKFRFLLARDGVIYMSFKEPGKPTVQGDRSFSNYNEHTLRNLISEVGGLEEVDMFRTEDVRKDHKNEFWINGIFRKCD